MNPNALPGCQLSVVRFTLAAVSWCRFCIFHWIKVWCDCHGRCGGSATTGGIGKTGQGVTPCFLKGIFQCNLAWMLQNGKPDLLKKNIDTVSGAW
jgi:hypothetical protein